MNSLVTLLACIEEKGLMEIAKKSPAYEIALAIIEDPTPDEVDVLMAGTLSNPGRWGLEDDPKWKEFVEGWNE